MKSTVTSDFTPTPQALAGLPGNTPVLLALSGGADSRALLHLLAAQRQECDFPLLLAHVDHGIRGEEAKRDSAFCRSLADAYGLELCVRQLDVPMLAAESGRGLEEEARAVRYAFFEELMREREIPILVTAHHGDDHLETVLFRMARGTGLRGLGGIAPVRPFANGWLVRPMLTRSRAEILDYCRQNKLEYVTDSTNAEECYARNRVRGQVVPVLESLFEHPQHRVLRMSESLREDEDCLTGLADAFLQEHCKDGVLKLREMENLHLAVRKRVWRQWVKALTHREPETVHVDALLALSHGETTLPGGFVAMAENGCVRIREEDQPAPTPFYLPFAEGCVCLDNGVTLRVTKGNHVEEHIKINNLSTATHINVGAVSDIMLKTLFWRSREPGDVIRMGGMHRKLRKLYNAAKIPPRMRERMPLLCGEEGILWAPFVGLRDHLPTGGESYLLEVIFNEASKEGNT